MDIIQEDMNVITFTNENIHIDRDILSDVELIENRSNTISLVKQTITLFLRSFRLNSHFNIIRFESDYKSGFDERTTIIHNEENNQRAEYLIKNMRADLGGTELLET